MRTQEYNGLRSILCIVAIMVFATFVSLSFNSCKSCSGGDDDVIVTDTIDTVPDSIGGEVLIMDEKETAMAKMKVNVKMPEFKDGKYSLRVAVAHPPKDSKLHFQLLMPFDEKIVAECDNGQFKDIAPSPDQDGGGIYRVRVTAEKDGKIIAKAENQAPGFIKQEKVSKKMTNAQLQSMVDRRDPDLQGIGESKYIAPDLKLSFSGLNNDDIKPEIMQDVFDKLDMGVWRSVKVTGMKYDNMNRICEIQFQVVH